MLKDLIARGVVKRKELFITTKLYSFFHAPEKVQDSGLFCRISGLACDKQGRNVPLLCLRWRKCSGSSWRICNWIIWTCTSCTAPSNSSKTLSDHTTSSP